MERLLKRRRFMFVDEQIKLLRQQTDELLLENIKLERILGLTVASNASLACSSKSHLIAYPAGCTIVFQGSKNLQRHIVSPAKKNVTCLSFSNDGRYLAVGECGHEPVIRVWDVEEHALLAELMGHKFAICCVAFSPNMKYLVSIGSQHDMVANVWDWRNNVKVSSNKVSCKVTALSFSENGDYFVTVGVRHVKFWYLDKQTSANRFQDTVPLQGRSAILADQRNNLFCDVCCGRGPTSSSTYCITQSGLLCEFNNRRLLDKWVELKTRFAGSLCLGDDVIYVGCADGVIRVFKAADFQYITNLPRPHYLGVDVAGGLSAKHMLSAPDFVRYPDVIAMCYDASQKKLISVYHDHSIYHWDVNDLKRIGKMASSLFHSSCIWNLETVASAGRNIGHLPLETFITCGNDDTVRFWNLNARFSSDLTNPYHRNIYSQELLKVVYCDPEMALLCDSMLGLSSNANGKSTDTLATGNVIGCGGVRCVRLSPNGDSLACGDRLGNIRIYDTSDLQLMKELEAHDDEILCLEYSDPSRGPFLLASCSRDRLLHLLDPSRLYAPLATVDDHSSTVTCVRFANVHGGDLIMVTSSADKSVICRRVDVTPKLHVVRMANIAGQGTSFTDLAVDADNNMVFAACQDRNIRIYSLLDGKLQRTIKASMSDDGFLLKIELDMSNTFVAASCSDKTVYLVDLTNDEFVASISGHGEVVTDLKFVDDCAHLLTVSADSCIFVWKLDERLTNAMRSRAAKKFANGFEPKMPLSVNGFLHTLSEGDPEPRSASPKTEVTEFMTRNMPLSRMSVNSDGALRDHLVASSVNKSSAIQLESSYVPPAVEVTTPSSDDNFTSFCEFDHQETTMTTQSHDISSEKDNVNNESSSPVIYLQPSGQNLNNGQFQVKDRLDLLKTSDLPGAFRTSDASDDDSIQERLTELKAADSLESLKFVVRDAPNADNVAESAFDGSSISSNDTRSGGGGGNFQRATSCRNSMSSRFLQKNFPENVKPKDLSESSWSPFPNSTPTVPIIGSNYSPRPSTSSSHTSSLSVPSSDRTEYTTDAGEAGRRIAIPHTGGYRSKWKIDERPPRLTQRLPCTTTASPSNSTNFAAATSLKTQTMQRFSTSLTDLLHCSGAKSSSPSGENVSLFGAPRMSRRLNASAAAIKRCDSMGSESSYEIPIAANQNASQLATSGGRRKIYSYFQAPPFPLERQSSPWLPFPSSSARRDSSSRLQGSISMSSLTSGVGLEAARTAPSVKRLLDVREKLKKSQENLAAICGDSRTGEFSSPLYVPRSKSFGDIVANTGLHSRMNSSNIASSPTVTGSTSLNRFTKSLAKSVGCLLSAEDALPLRPLIDTIKDIKKISNTDLRDFDVGTPTADVASHHVSLVNDSSSDSFGFYNKSLTLPRSRHSNGPTQKRAQHSRLTGSKKTFASSTQGYNDSEDSSDASSRRLLPSSPKYASPRRTSISNDSMTSPTLRRINAAAAGRGFLLTRRGADPLAINPAAVGHRSMNYFSRMLKKNPQDDSRSISDVSFSPDPAHSDANRGGSNDGSWPRVSELSDLSDNGDYADLHFKKMYGHCKETKENFLTSVDKILQAYNLVLEDSEISVTGKEELMSVILSTLESVQKRLDQTLNQARFRKKLAVQKTNNM